MTDSFPSVRVNLRRTAELLGVSRQTLSDWCARFPELRALGGGGGTGQEYAFDPEEAIAWRRAKLAEERAKKARDEAFIAQLDLPAEGLVGTHPDAQKPRDVLTTLKVQQLRRQIDREAGKLVETAVVLQAQERACVKLTTYLRSAVEQAARAHNLPEPVKRAMLQAINDGMRRCAADLASFGPERPPGGLFGNDGFGDAPQSAAAA